MNLYYTMLCCAPVLLACSSGQDTTSARNTDTVSEMNTGSHAAAAPQALPPLPACYNLLQSGDTVLLRLQQQTTDGELSGSIEYHQGGQLKETGSFFGQMTGDTLFANYSYMQKQRRKVREVAFLRRGAGWIEGKGPAAEQAGIKRFTDRDKLAFDGALFVLSSCR